MAVANQWQDQEEQDHDCSARRSRHGLSCRAGTPLVLVFQTLGQLFVQIAKKGRQQIALGDFLATFPKKDMIHLGFGFIYFPRISFGITEKFLLNACFGIVIRFMSGKLFLAAFVPLLQKTIMMKGHLCGQLRKERRWSIPPLPDFCLSRDILVLIPTPPAYLNRASVPRSLSFSGAAS